MSPTSTTALDLLAALSQHSGLILASDAARVGLQRELRQEFDRQAVIRLRRGVYVLTAEWDALGPDARYLRRIHAHAAVAEAPAVYSHFSAAALWGLPIVGAWPTEIHLATPAATGGRSRGGVIRHPQEHSLDVVDHQGLRVTSAATTAVAMARVLRFAQAVAVMDKTGRWAPPCRHWATCSLAPASPEPTERGPGPSPRPIWQDAPAIAGASRHRGCAQPQGVRPATRGAPSHRGCAQPSRPAELAVTAPFVARRAR